MRIEIISWVKTHRLITSVVGLISCLGIGVIILVAGLRPPVTPGPADAALAPSSSSHASKPSQQQASSAKVAMATHTASGPAYVDVKGAVKQPGIYQVKPEMRVADVLSLAQGMLPQADQTQVNLAAKVTDQQVIYVPAKGEQPATTIAKPAASVPATANTGASGSTATPVTKAKSVAGVAGASAPTNRTINLNTADVAALQKLSGVGQKKAEKIIAYRDQHGGFKSVSELTKVGGIGEKTLAKFKDQLTV
ncbi:helix-hairpin-helix domain-containing protein [Lactiplantibacillus sp. WILCCON 0030]|uniref:Helix-hairpin-helix domain-containing protein n=1 Tax=Lactiplantibacillus brownii TaxID=3069269 RepID=A0ABU1A9E3_9LACO|nr:helix-hairpin-helix domain-containing protein [Lactiplantibacillus brownii]MDQ7937579.1 helix-hairpin-helix domain-containing protein [Lactiplantibacillus brownii]